MSVALSFSVAVLATQRDTRAGSVSDWEASSGLLPTQISPPYSLAANGNATDVLGGGFLTVSTVADSDELLFRETDPIVDTSSPFYIEARLRFVSGQSSNAARAPAEIFFTTAPGVGNFLWIDQGKVFFDTGLLVAGPSAAVDTSGAFHTYRINYDGAGGLSLLYDGALVLTGHTYTSVSDFGETKQISWGDGTDRASGMSEWQYFKHDALTAVPEPSSMYLLGAGGAFLSWLTARSSRRDKASKSQASDGMPAA
jgi:hypothetical protein